MSEPKKQWETRENTGSAFRNKRKQKDTHPDYTGEINIEGKLYWLNTWEKRTQNGDVWYSHSVNPKEDKPSQQSAPAATPMQQQLDDTVPF